MRSAVVCAILCLTSGAHGNDIEVGVDDVMKKAGISDKTPGAAAMVIQGDKVLFEKCYGLANLQRKTPIRRETTFELASMSKTFTGVAICQLHDQGKLKLDDPVRKYIPELPHDTAHDSLRISNLLQHTSGLSDYTGWPDPKSAHPGYSDNEDFVRMMVQKPKFSKLHFPVGQKHDYCNTNFLLLAVIASRISHQPYGQFMRQQIFEPLGMKHTWIYDHPDANLKHHSLGDVNALGYEKNDQGKWEVTWGSPPFRRESILTCGDGSVWTNLEDLVLWDQAVRSRRLLKEETWNQALTPSKTLDGETNDYGFGWDLEFDKKGELSCFGHSGSWSGFRTQYNRYPKADRSIIVLSNRADFESSDVADGIAAVVNQEQRKVMKERKQTRNKKKPPVESAP